jgi:hypothetical protein
MDTAIEHHKLQVLQRVQPSNSIIFLVALLAGSNSFLAATALVRRLTGLAMI